MKKTVALLVVLILLSCTALSAASVEELYQIVLDRSSSINELFLTNYYSFVESALSSLNGPSWTVEVQGAEVSVTDELASHYYQLPSLEITYSTPETPDKVTFDARASLGSIKFESQTDFKPGPFDISFHGGVRKTFEFKSWDSTDYRKGLSDEMNAIEYENTILRYEIEFLNDIAEAMLAEREVIRPTTTAAVLSAKYDDYLERGIYTEDSPEAIKLDTEMNVRLTEARQVMESYTSKTHQIAEKYNLTSDEVMDVDSAKKYDLSLTPFEGGNYEVHAKYAEVMSIQQQIDAKLGKSSTLTLRASLDPKIGFREELNHETNGISGEFGASYTTGKLSLDLSISTGYTYNIETLTPSWNGPTITIGGSWSNTPQALSKEETERLKALYTTGGTFNREAYENVIRDLSINAQEREIIEIEKLEGDLDDAIQVWMEALNTYTGKCNDLIQRIREFNNNYELFMIQYEGAVKLADRMNQLLEEDKVSPEEAIEANTEKTLMDIDLIVLNIKSHILYNEIQMLQK